MNGKKGQIHATLRPSGRRMLAEWEPQSCVQLTWPHAGTDWVPMLADITAVYEEMAHAISKREALMIVAPKSLTPTCHPSPPTSYPSPPTTPGPATTDSSPSRSLTGPRSYSTSSSTAGDRSLPPSWTTRLTDNYMSKSWSRAATSHTWTLCSRAAALRATDEAPSSPPVVV